VPDVSILKLGFAECVADVRRRLKIRWSNWVIFNLLAQLTLNNAQVHGVASRTWFPDWTRCARAKQKVYAETHRG
jgi:hypothetical protein